MSGTTDTKGSNNKALIQPFQANRLQANSIKPVLGPRAAKLIKKRIK